MFNNYELAETNNIFQDILLPLSERQNKRYFYQLLGVPENSKEYFNELYFLNKELEKEKFYIKFENKIPLIDVSQIVKEIREAFTFKDLTQLDFVFKKCFSYINDFQTEEIKKYFQKHFLDICRDWFVETNRSKKITFDMAVNFGVKMLCWTTEVYGNLFFNNIDKIPKVLYYGKIKDQEVYFLEFLFNVGCDILYINTENVKNLKLDSISKKKIYPQNCILPSFPTKEQIVSQETSGLQAQKEVENNYYNEDVIRPFQFQDYKAKIVPLKFSYGELWNLWEADSNIRPGFKARNKEVYIPTICCKINGIEDDKIFEERLEKLSDRGNCIVYDNCKLVHNQTIDLLNELIFNKSLKDFYRNGVFRIEDFKNSSLYKYRHLRKGIQDRVLKFALNKDVSSFNRQDWKDWSKCFWVLFNLEEKILDLWQQFDYGFQVPKVIIYHNNELYFNEYDRIFIKILWYLDFDILSFSPIGYCDIEDLFHENEELNVFQLDELSQKFKNPFQKKNIISNNSKGLFERIFGK